MKLELYDFQREDVDRFIREGHEAGLIAYDMALGKTLTATTLAVELGTQVNLIVAPQVTFAGWEKAVETQTDGAYALRWMKRGTKGGEAILEDFYDGVPGWYFITWQLMRNGVLFETKADMVIADEVHEIQNKGVSAQNILMDEIKSSYRIGLSGTMSGNKLAGIFGAISWAWPTKYKSYWNWLKKHFLLAGFGHSLSPIREITPGTVTGELPFFVRRLKEDLFADLIPAPLPLRQIFVDMAPKQADIYHKFDETSGSWLDAEDDSAGFMYSQYSIVKMIRLRELALGTPVMVESDDGKWVTSFEMDTISPKLDALIELLKSEGNAGETAVVFTHSKKFIEVVVARLEAAGIKAKEFSGSLNYKQKRKAIDDFGEKYQVLVATQASIGTGTDGLQYKCSRMVVLSRDVKMIVNEQARERLYRPGQTERVQSWEIVANGTNDLVTNGNLDYDSEVVGNMLDANKIK